MTEQSSHGYLRNPTYLAGNHPLKLAPVLGDSLSLSLSLSLSPY